MNKELRKAKFEEAQGMNQLGCEEKVNGYGKVLKEEYIDGKISEEQYNEKLLHYYRAKYGIGTGQKPIT